MTMDKKLKILIVEDEIIIALRLEEELRRLGHHVVGSVVTGEEAIGLTEETQPDIILMDIHLASPMNGLEAARQIRTVSPVPFVFITGYPDEKLQAEAVKLQPAVYIVKPILNYEMRMAINLMTGKSG